MKNVLLFFTLVLQLFFLFFVSDVAYSSGKQKSNRPRPLTDEDLQNFLDMLDNDDDDDALTDTDIEDGDSDDDEDTKTNFVNIVDNKVGTNIIQVTLTQTKLLMMMKLSELLTIISQ